MRWIYRAQDANGDGGVSHSYLIGTGWMRSYPETTGYIIPTLLNWHATTQDDEPRRRALAMADWELGLQLDSGAIPNLTVFRPADANEVAECWKVVMRLTDRPALLVLTRQAVPTLDRGRLAEADGVKRGAYVLADPPGGDPQVLLLGTGSEVSLCVQAHEMLTRDGIPSRVVSMPSWELFDEQPREYRDAVLRPGVTARIAVEAAATMGWERYVGAKGRVIGMRSFGASAPYPDLQRRFGLTPDHVVAAARQVLEDAEGVQASRRS